MLYLLRHGETDYNRTRRVQGQLDSQLNDLGRQQARAMAELLARLIPDPSGWRLVSSPLSRTRDTAQAVADALGLTVETDERLIEISCGDWQDRTYAELHAEHPEVFGRRDWFFNAPGGETYEQVMNRVSDWLGEQPPEPQRRVIAVSHGVAGRLLRGAYAGLPREAVLQQDVPQDALFRLQGGQIERIACDPVAA